MDDQEFLKFKDWLDSEEHIKSDWITVGRFDSFGKSNPDNRGTFSALIRNDQHDMDRTLASFDWDVMTDFGYPFFAKSDEDNSVSLDLGLVDVRGGVKFEPFCIYRDFHEVYESRIEIIQSFILYHNLSYDAEQGKFFEPLTEETVIDYVESRNVLTRATYLKEYLAARRMALVRFHDHRRFLQKDIKTIFGKDSEVSTVKKTDAHYMISVGSLPGKDETFARLLGKDIVRPHAEPNREDYLSLAGKQEKLFLKFVIGADKEGKSIESTCNEEELSNNFVNKGTPHFLTPVFFRREVLKRYYDSPRRYTVLAGLLSCLDLWDLPYGINKEGLVHVWLGDLGKIPYDEQLHWRRYNVTPFGGLEDTFVKTQLLAQFAESKEPVYQLQRAKQELNEKFRTKFGFPLFKDLAPEDSYIEKSIHIPSSNEQKELDDQLVYLAKYLVDSLNKSLLEAQVSWRPSKPEENTHTRFLQGFLSERMNIPPTEALQIVSTFRTLQSLRSISAAHLKSDEYKKNLQKLGLGGLSYQKIVEKLVMLMTASLRNIVSSIP